MTISCAECGAPMVLRNSRYGTFYGCKRYPDCEGIHGAHQATGAPLGKPADKETRQWRIEAHEAFDAVWRSGGVSRSKAYKRLAAALGIPNGDCHIGNFDMATCRRVVEICELGSLNRREQASV